MQFAESELGELSDILAMCNSTIAAAREGDLLDVGSGSGGLSRGTKKNRLAPGLVVLIFILVVLLFASWTRMLSKRQQRFFQHEYTLTPHQLSHVHLRQDPPQRLRRRTEGTSNGRAEAVTTKANEAVEAEAEMVMPSAAMGGGVVALAVVDDGGHFL